MSDNPAMNVSRTVVPLYRAAPGDGVAWVTGASSGLGRALAIELASAGYTVAATARDEQRLDTLIAATAGLPGRVVAFPCDVTDESGMLRVVSGIERQLGPIALGVFNAGTYFPTRGARLDVQNFVRTFELNVFGVIYGLVPLVSRMQSRKRGQIVIVGSITSYVGLPSAAAYGASKAALNSTAEALKYDFDKLNIRLQIVHPGFIKTPLTDRLKFPMPALMPVRKAAVRVADGIRSGGFEITFPRRLTWPMKALRLLPRPVIFRLISRVTRWGSRPMASGRKPKK